MFLAAYQASGIAKSPATTEYIIDWLEGSDPSQKLVVFAHHKEVLDYIETTISQKYKGKLGMMRIDGSVPPAERATRVKKFQTNKSIRLSLLSMTAAGVGLTLTAASNIVFAELHWTPGVLAQAEDRCHRIGQANSVNVMYCICKDEDVSVDMSLWQMIARKVGNLGKVVDGERAKLNAVEKDNIPSNKEKAGASVEEELTTFFASSNLSPAKRQKKGGPVVKGSIQSFFNKSKTTKPSSSLVVGKEKANARKAKVVECISLLDDDDSDKQKRVPQQNTLTNTITLLDDDDIKQTKKIVNSGKVSGTTVFTCHACTYDNEMDVEACAICSAPRIYPTKSSNTSEATSQWSCRKCTYLNESGATNCDICQEMRPVQLTENDCGDDNNAADSKQAQRSKSTYKEYQFDDDSDDWKDEDLAAIDLATQSHAKISQSPISPDKSQKSCDSSLKRKSCQPITATDLLSFSVSRNSGRVALHMAGLPLHINLDISQVLTKECADALEEVQFQRKANVQVGHNLAFDDEAVKQVLAVLDDDTMLPDGISYKESLPCMSKEVKQFVMSYMSLREVEKKVIKESGRVIAPSLVKQTAAELLVSTVSGTTDRYQGGAKERAIINQQNNCATDLDKKVLNGEACIWCGGDFLTKNGAHYCSYKCAEDGRLRRGGMYSSTRIREQLFALEHGICTKCGVDAHSLFVKILALQPAERLNALLNAKWKLPKTSVSNNRLLSDPKEHDFWQADHEQAVAEGGGACGLDNLRTLCTPCHSKETEQLLARLKTLPVSEQSTHKQMDIYSAFSNSTKKKKKKRRRVAD